MATTTNYNWTTPDDTSLVKDGAAAIRTLGSSVDTTTKNLNPSTTLGDIEYRSATANTNTRLGIGTTGQVLTVSGGVPVWAAVAAGGMTSIATGSLSGNTITLSSIPGTYIDLVLVLDGYSFQTTQKLQLRYNGITTSTYNIGGPKFSGGAGAGTFANTGEAYWITSDTDADVASTRNTATIRFVNYANTASVRQIEAFLAHDVSSNIQTFNGFGYQIGIGAITSIGIHATSGTGFDGGTYTLYGVK